MRVYDGYLIKGNKKKAFTVGAGSKKQAHADIKERYPDWRVYITGYHLERGKR